MTETTTRAKSATRTTPEPTKVTPASTSFANYIRAQGHDISDEAVALTFRYHREWQKSPERAAERDHEKAERLTERENAKAVRNAERAKRLAAEKAKLEERLAKLAAK
ncbi:hypothetical protein [Mycolicibacterium goodii]|uniref:hypothetical protein n=1 Tax=Mycolicibacterium goodii TaxID=134601 RepID=UPI000C261C94|nr:hypothetical protein [Mycolicibacterium goodii]PJK24405.1 hypothetical protein CSX11_00635 [Mycolicibacterium goodii]